MRRGASSVGVVLVLVVSGCSSPASIEVEPARPLLTAKDQTLQLTAKVKDEQGKMIRAGVMFKSLTPTMASIDELGAVQTVTSGTTTILVEAGKASKQVEVLIQIPQRIAIDPENPLMMLGVTRRFKGTVFDDRKKPMIAGEIRWTSSDPTVFTVDRYGDVKTIKEGKAVLTAHAAGITGTTEIVVKHEEMLEDGTLTQ